MQQNSLITDDSDESDRKKFMSVLSRIENEADCGSRINTRKKVKDGQVKVKRKLFFYKKRFMML